MIILDTNVLSELMRPKPSTRVVAWVAKQPAAELFTTAITEAEIFYGIELLTKGKRREALLLAAEAMFAEDLAGRIFGFDSDAARIFSKIAAHRRALGKPITHADAQIAAIAQVRSAKLATRNVADFEDCDLALVDPWNGQDVPPDAANTPLNPPTPHSTQRRLQIRSPYENIPVCLSSIILIRKPPPRWRLGRNPQEPTKQNSSQIQPAKGKLGVMIPGMGAVATTFVAGVEAIRKGIAKPIGSLTQMGTVRLGKRTDARSPKIKEFVPIAALDDLVFTGWDIFPEDMHAAATKAGVLDRDLLDQVKPLLSSIKPRKAVFDHNYVKLIDGPNVKEGQEQNGSRRAGASRHPRLQKNFRSRAPNHHLVRIDRNLYRANRRSSVAEIIRESAHAE